MKIIARSLAILAAALLVCGATFALAGSSYVQAAFPARPGHAERMDGPRPPAIGAGAVDSPGSATPGVGGPSREEGRRPGGFGAIEMLKNLAIIAVIVAITAPIVRLARRRASSAAQTPRSRRSKRALF